MLSAAHAPLPNQLFKERPNRNTVPLRFAAPPSGSLRGRGFYYHHPFVSTGFFQVPKNQPTDLHCDTRRYHPASRGAAYTKPRLSVSTAFSWPSRTRSPVFTAMPEVTSEHREARLISSHPNQRQHLSSSPLPRDLKAIATSPAAKPRSPGARRRGAVCRPHFSESQALISRYFPAHHPLGLARAEHTADRNVDLATPGAEGFTALWRPSPRFGSA